MLLCQEVAQKLTGFALLGHIVCVLVLEWLYTSPQIKLTKRAPELKSELVLFHEETFYWMYALNLNSVIPKAGDLSPMWFRESYLTMEVAKVNPDPQFGLNESIPWLLAEHLLESESGALIEHCLSECKFYHNDDEPIGSLVNDFNFLPPTFLG